MVTEGIYKKSWFGEIFIEIIGNKNLKHPYFYLKMYIFSYTGG